MNTRKENDCLGSVNVPADSYGGSFYTRAKSNFQISELKSPATFREALAIVKKAAAQVNSDLGHLDPKLAKAIQDAADEFIDGKFDGDYDLDVYQAGAGTPYNMNLNEILANRANELLGGKKGTYDPINPNNHVNMAQSSNDVIPTATRIAAVLEIKKLLRKGTDLLNAFEAKSKEFGKHVKVGRTHLQDAVPVTLGQEFGAYASSIRNGLARIEAASWEMNDLGIGGTATGSGINSHPDFSKKMCQEISRLTEIDFKPADNRFETTHSMAPLAACSSTLTLLANELIRITNDLRLLSSGPRAGFNEINLPEVEPGSSIMPGKVNPSALECMNMICIQIMGLNHAIHLSAQQGQLELNFHCPLIMLDLLHQIEILTNGMEMLTNHCIKGITANPDQMKGGLDRSTALATALAPYMGYHEVGNLVNRSLEENVPFESLVPEEFKKHLEADQMTKPNRTT